MRGSHEEGAAAALVVAMAGMLVFVLIGLSAVGGLVTAQRRAQAAADLAALAAAAALRGGSEGCAEATRVAAANDATLDACTVTGQDAWVEVSVSGPQWPGRRLRVGAEARAGPG